LAVLKLIALDALSNTPKRRGTEKTEVIWSDARRVDKFDQIVKKLLLSGTNGHNV